MNTVFATTRESRAAELEHLAEAEKRNAAHVDAALADLDTELQWEARVFLGKRAYHDPDSATRGSRVQRDHDVAGHIATVARLIEICVNQLTRAGVSA